MRPCGLCRCANLVPGGRDARPPDQARIPEAPNRPPPHQRTVTFYQQLAIDDGLSVKRLAAAIQGDHYLSALEQPKGKPLELPRPTNPSYLDKAEIRDVVDADTLLLDVDLGFEVIRLACIDAPARDTPFRDLVANSSPTNPSSER